MTDVWPFFIALLAAWLDLPPKYPESEGNGPSGFDFQKFRKIFLADGYKSGLLAGTYMRGHFQETSPSGNWLYGRCPCVARGGYDSLCLYHRDRLRQAGQPKQRPGFVFHTQNYRINCLPVLHHGEEAYFPPGPSPRRGHLPRRSFGGYR